MEALVASDPDGTSEVVPVHDKWSGALLAEVPTPSQDDIAGMLARADSAWRSEWLPLERSRALQRAAELLRARAGDMIPTYMAETGFTTADAENEFDRAVMTLSLCAEEATRLHGDIVPLHASPAHARNLAFTVRQPIGVVLAITPFNFPLNGPCHKIGPALAAGDSVILKPSELTPLSGLALASLLWEAGVPRERLQVAVGPGDTVGAPLLQDPRVAFTTFTGSTRVGAIVKSLTGFRPCTLELGNVSPTIVCSDADLSTAVPEIVRGAFLKAGQVCTSVQTVHVAEEVADDLIGAVVDATKALVVGDPGAPETDVGPVISDAAADRIEQLCHDARRHGATLLAGGERDGTLVSPTVFADVAEGSPLITEEAFGPVLGVVRFEDFDEAIAGVNASPYGLQAGVYTGSIDLALRAAETLQVGGLIVNGTPTTRADGMPFGGQKRSGYGKEGPASAIKDMTVERLVLFRR